ncbi:MAG: hypothetical protein M0Z53_00705 [Thermaerobacter sp.]|nr:hypothetical protein [Thermaerobacter sp.]
MGRVRRRAVCTVATESLMALSSGATGWYFYHQEPDTASRIPPGMAANSLFLRFVDAYRVIRQDAVRQTSPAELSAGAPTGLAGTLHDRFSSCFPHQPDKGLFGCWLIVTPGSRSSGVVPAAGELAGYPRRVRRPRGCGGG